jgi:hypothetical protein
MEALVQVKSTELKVVDPASLLSPLYQVLLSALLECGPRDAI